MNINMNCFIGCKLTSSYEESNSSIAIVFIEDDNLKKEKIYLKAKIQGKFISKNLNNKKDIKENNSKDRVISLINSIQ